MAIDVRNTLVRMAELIKLEREARRISQTQLAVDLGISQGQLSKIEKQIYSPTIEIWLIFCDLFKISTELPLRDKQYSDHIESLNQSISDFRVKQTKIS